MKQIDETFWVKKYITDNLGVGFTAQGLSNLGVIWNFIPRAAIGDRVKFGQAIASIESTHSLKSLCIPVEGILTFINPEILEFPEGISEKTEVFVFEKVNYALLGL